MTTSTQVNHGLNLVLKLRDPHQMTALLLEIDKARPRIDAGLDELNFVHFARFLPTHDGSALQVITEFDGPLAPYVLDFAIEIGDVFDMLLSYTEGTEQILPIREHPAEFLAFVEKNNRVNVGGQPFPKEWNLYSAYRDTTVLDIIGPRAELPMPKADRAATPVQAADVQGNILKGYRAQRVKHVLLRVVDARLARAWLAARATSDAQTTPVPKVTSHDDWRPDAKPELMLNIGLTAVGMQALGIDEKWLDLFPLAFTQGAFARAAGNFDVGSNAPEHWWLGGPGQEREIHVMVSLYQRRRSRPGDLAFEQAVEALVNQLPSSGLQAVEWQDAEQIDGRGVLGYADGKAHPRVAGIDPAERTDRQPASTAGEFVLGADYKNIYGGSSLGSLPPGLASNGSFCAVRVLAQDGEIFRAALQSEAKRLGVRSDWLAAKLMGRWFDGAPVSLHPNEPPADPAENGRNDFDYAPSYEFPSTAMDHAGLRCPVGAHIRRANPRTARIAGARYARRLMRRGMNYKRNVQGKQEHGLFGLFICADLERQFEFIQRQWLNGDRFAAGLRGTRDPFGGTPEYGLHEFEIPMPDRSALKVRLPQFVHTRGSLYLFLPGLAALRDLEKFVSHDPSLPGGGGKPPGSSPAPSAPALTFDPTQRDFRIDPYPVFAQFRASRPVHYSARFDGWFVFGYGDVYRVCEEKDSFSADVQRIKDNAGLFQLDDPRHGKVRELVAGAWFKAASQVEQMIDKSLRAALAAIDGRPGFDLVDDFARPVPRDVYFDILGGQGISPAERLALDKLARTVREHHDHTLSDAESAPGVKAGAELGSRLVRMLIAAGSAPQFEGSFLGNLAPAYGKSPFTESTAARSLVSLTVAGYMSVEFLLATGIRRLLLDDARWWREIQADTKQPLLPACLEEMRRYEHALAVVDRITNQEVRFGDIVIPPGKRVYGVLASANRDKVFGSDAEQFNPHRKSKTEHLGFGHGIHECMGRALEALITPPAIGRLMDTMPGLRLRSPAETPPWFTNFYFRSFDHLEVTTK